MVAVADMQLLMCKMPMFDLVKQQLQHRHHTNMISLLTEPDSLSVQFCQSVGGLKGVFIPPPPVSHLDKNLSLDRIAMCKMMLIMDGRDIVSTQC